MEDVFDGGRRSYDEKVVVVLRDEDATDQESSEDETEESAAPHQDFEPGSKRHQRTQSLEEAVEIPWTKRQNRPQTLDEMSATASGEKEFEAAYVVDSVGEMPTTLKSVMESSNAAKWRSESNRLSVGVPDQGKPSWRDRAVQGATGGQGILAEIRRDYEETFAPVAKFTSIRILVINMRLRSAQEVESFADYLLRVGDGRHEPSSELGGEFLKISEDMLFHTSLLETTKSLKIIQNIQIDTLTPRRLLLTDGGVQWAASRDGDDELKRLKHSDLQNVYNMDESAFFYNAVPRGPICKNAASALKQDKARVTMAVCCNADGSDKLPML
ncbi:unnamed protein product [Phytophthora lilii]|uniref:Unnamed protein product n=1 Tax=Phytophthora lilii TaxID=2077276 RepID=A0A9W7CUB0_9STRA|nr:unnamed protein product [Phytophthora lilii]